MRRRPVFWLALTRADLKTQSQFIGQKGVKPPGLIEIAKTTLRRNGIAGFYSGVGALCAGNSVKAAVRFVAYDRFKILLRKEDGKLTPVRSLLGPWPRAGDESELSRTSAAGTGAGVMEAIFAVTPSETIKCG